MMFNRFANLVLSGAVVLSVAGSSGPAWCGEVPTQEQNLALLKAIEADLAKKPDNTLLQLQHAAVMGRLKRYEAQVAEASYLIKKDPKLREAYLIRSDGEANQKRYADALASLDMAFRLGSPTPKLLLFKATYLKNEKKYKEAIETLNRVIEAEPSNATAYNFRAVCFFRLFGPCEKALYDMERVVALDPTDSKARLLVADLKRELRAPTATSKTQAN